MQLICDVLAFRGHARYFLPVYFHSKNLTPIRKRLLEETWAISKFGWFYSFYRTEFLTPQIDKYHKINFIPVHFTTYFVQKHNALYESSDWKYVVIVYFSQKHYFSPNTLKSNISGSKFVLS